MKTKAKPAKKPKLASQPFANALRTAIKRSKQSKLKISQDSGVDRASLSRFISTSRSLRLDKADKLAVYFGLKVTVPK